MNISVTEPVSLAYARMKRILFDPFNPAKWFLIGFTAWLSEIGSGSLPVNVLGEVGKSSANELGNLDTASALGWVLGALFVIVSISVAIGWLAARGQFMFLDNVVRDRSEVSASWRAYRVQGNSLFLWRFFLGWILFLLIVPLILLILFFIMQRVLETEFLKLLPAWLASLSASVSELALPLLALGLLLLFIVWYAYLFLNEFVVPLMYKYRLCASDAWRRFLPLMQANTGSFLFYGVFRFLLDIVSAFCILAFIAMTCCVAGILMIIPYLGTVTILPVFVTLRLYSLYYLRQFGSDFDALAYDSIDRPEPDVMYVHPETRPEPGEGDPNNPYYPYR